MMKTLHECLCGKMNKNNLTNGKWFMIRLMLPVLHFINKEDAYCERAMC